MDSPITQHLISLRKVRFVATHLINFINKRLIFEQNQRMIFGYYFRVEHSNAVTRQLNIVLNQSLDYISLKTG